MLVKINKTYRGKHGLLIQGHLYDLTSGQISAIQSELEQQKSAFEFEKVKDAVNFNRPPKKKGTPSNKQQTGDSDKDNS